MHEVVQAYLNWNSVKKKKVKKNQCLTSTEFKNKEYLVKKMQQMLYGNSNLSHVWYVCVTDYTNELLMS